VSERTDLIARLPYVTRLDETQDCDGYRWSHMSFKALRDPDLMAKYKCQARARWRFRAMKKSAANPFPAEDGIFCWHHLFSLGLFRGMAEEARFRRAMERLRDEERS
jgi:hypothetical protein